MNLNVKKCKTRSCIQPHADPHCPDYMKYIIIDSENEDEIISKKLFESISNGELPLQDERKSVIMKSKGSANPNFLSNHIEPAKTVDYEISDAEQEVRGLKAECELLEKMISDMIEEQAKLKVSFRKRERRESIKKEESQQHDKKCSFYNYQSSSETRASNEVSDVLREKFSNILVK
jgi:regulator of replication initiation timing